MRTTFGVPIPARSETPAELAARRRRVAIDTYRAKHRGGQRSRAAAFANGATWELYDRPHGHIVGVVACRTCHWTTAWNGYLVNAASRWEAHHCDPDYDPWNDPCNPDGTWETEAEYRRNRADYDGVTVHAGWEPDDEATGLEIMRVRADDEYNRYNPR